MYITKSLYSLSYDYRRPDISSALRVVATDSTANKLNAINTNKKLIENPIRWQNKSFIASTVRQMLRRLNAGSR